MSDYTVVYHPNDGFTLYALIGDHLVWRRFIGYSLEEATAIMADLYPVLA